MSTVEKKLTEMLNEEKWTRAAITNYSISNFIELDKLIEQAVQNNSLETIKSICDEHLTHSKNSIIALYIAGIISLMKKMLDDSNQITLIGIFIDNHKLQIVEHLCLRILEFGDSNAKFALRTLADCYKEVDDDRVYDIWERILKIDFEEADIAKFLAEKYEKDGDIENAVEYYKKAIYRFINLKQSSGIKEMWNKLVLLVPDEIDFFYRIQSKISSIVGNSKNSALMLDLYNYYKDLKNWKIAIDILKLILSYDDKDEFARNELVECLRHEYAEHSQLEEYIKVSSLNLSWRPVFDALADFEKHISFDVGNFVFHRSWGVGRISKIEDDDLTIDFAKKRNHTMSLKMGVSALQTLSKNHIWVLKATEKNKSELAKKIKADPRWGLETIILSFNNSCDMKKIKQEIVPSLLTQGEWASWSTKARRILNEDPAFDINPNNVDSYMVRKREVSIEEKLSNEFKAKKNFFSRVDIINKYTDRDSDTFHEMFNYFDGFLKSVVQLNEQVIAAYLLVDKISAEVPHINSQREYNFAELYERIEDPASIYIGLKDKELRKLFLDKIKAIIPNWQEEFIKIFPTALSRDILDFLVEDGKEKLIQTMVMDCFENYRVYREAVIWFFKNAQDEEWFQALGVDKENQIIILIHILDITYREIASRKNTTENRKINRMVHSILFGKDNMLEEFILQRDEDRVTKLYTLVSDIKDLEPTIKASLRSKILDKYKDFKFFDIEEKEIVSHGLIVTQKMLEAKKKELQEIKEIRMPQNARDLAYAMSLGDLRENAEYKAAKEEQLHLNSLSAKLEDEIERAEVFDPTRYSGGKVFFGTKVYILNINTKEKEEYTILGPWESDPKNGIISYMSPLGNGLLHSKKGDKISFMINEEKKNYEILNIEAIDLSSI